MISKANIKLQLVDLIGMFVKKSDLQEKLQILLSTKNKLEKGDNKDTREPFSFYFTNGEANSTSNVCDIRIDYLKTRNKNILYIYDYDILTYIK